jgi:hypothetical protein
VLTARCRDCGATFRSAREADQCLRCHVVEAATLAAAGRAVEREAPPPPKWSRAWMREYLGVTGDRDE